MSSIWNINANNITNGINSVLADFSNKFVEGNNAINKVCGDINEAVQGLLKNSNDEAQRVADEIARQQAEQNANTDGGYSDGGGSSGSSSSTKIGLIIGITLIVVHLMMVGLGVIGSIILRTHFRRDFLT